MGCHLALHAVHLRAEEQPRRGRRGGDRLVVEVGQEERARAFSCSVPSASEQLADRLRPRTVLMELTAEEAGQRNPVNRLVRRPPHQEVRPLRGEVPGEVVPASSSSTEPRQAVPRRSAEEGI